MLQVRHRPISIPHRRPGHGRRPRGPIVVRPSERVTVLRPEPFTPEVRVSVTEADEGKQTGQDLCEQFKSDPLRLARAVAKHYARHFLGTFTEARSVSCNKEGRVCRVKLANGIVVQVVLSHMPAYVSAQMVQPSTALPVAFDYHCDIKGLHLERRK